MNYPHFFSTIQTGSKFIYNGAKSNTYALENQEAGLKYNMILENKQI